MDEAHFSEAHYFDELFEEGKAALARPRGIPSTGMGAPRR